MWIFIEASGNLQNRSGKVLIHSRLWQFSVRPQDVAAHPILSRPTASQIWELVNKIDYLVLLGKV